MAFVFYDEDDKVDKVSFYMRKDFRDEGDMIVTEFIERGDTTTKLAYIDKYMNTKVKEKRPGTPAYLILRT